MVASTFVESRPITVRRLSVSRCWSTEAPSMGTALFFLDPSTACQIRNPAAVTPRNIQRKSAFALATGRGRGRRTGRRMTISGSAAPGCPGPGAISWSG